MGRYLTVFAHNKSGAGEGGKQGKTIGNRFLQGDVGHVLLGGIQQYLEGINTHEAEVSQFLHLAFYMDWDEWLSRHIADMVQNDGGPGENPELRVISNHSRHFANIGEFQDTQPLSNRALQLITEISMSVQKWPDAQLLNSLALEAIQDNQTGSGRSGNTNTRKVPEATRGGDTVMAETMDDGQTPNRHHEHDKATKRIFVDV